MRGGAALCCFLLIMNACGSKDSKTGDTVKELNAELDRLTKTVTDFVQTAQVPEELKKLQQFEYKVIEIPRATPSPDVENRLNELGKERWDCTLGGSSATIESLTFYCKRRPDTPLKYVPKTFLGSGM